jgi:outer membrane protein TolC
MRWLWFMCVGFAPLVCVRAQVPVQLALEDALAAVERVNVNVLLSREGFQQAVEAANLQRADLLPSVGAAVQQRRSESPLITRTSKTAGTPTNRSDARLLASLALLSPQQIAQYRAAQVGVEVAQLDVQQTIQTILATAAQTFFAHLRNVKRIDVLEANVRRGRDLLALARNQVAAGVATQIDITRAESQLALAEQARLQQETVVYESELRLKRLLDLEAGGSIALVDFVVRRNGEPPFQAGEEKTLFERRSDYLRARRQLDQTSQALRAVQWERFGALSLTGEYGLANSEVFAREDQVAWSAGVALSIPVFDGQRIRSGERQTRSQIRSQEFRLRQLELQIAGEVRLAHQDARSRHAQVGVAEKSLSLSMEELQLAQRRFEQGVADNREIVDAQNRLALASDNLNEAIYQYNLSRVELARTRGDVRAILGERE